MGDTYIDNPIFKNSQEQIKKEMIGEGKNKKSETSFFSSLFSCLSQPNSAVGKADSNDGDKMSLNTSISQPTPMQGSK
jgi:hypothetical protein